MKYRISVKGKTSPVSTSEPEIVKRGSYIILGVRDHCKSIHKRKHVRNSLLGAEYLLMEGEETQLRKHSSTKSVEAVCFSLFDSDNIQYLPEPTASDSERLLRAYGIPLELAEVSLPPYDIVILVQRDKKMPDIPEIIEKYKNIAFDFIDIDRTNDNLIKIMESFMEKGREVSDLITFSNDFSRFYAEIREYEYWLDDIRRFRDSHSGQKTAICCGINHVTFVSSVMENRDVAKPNWRNHLSTRKNREELRPIYRELQSVLGVKLNLAL
ncbi:MAG: hypothetical protein ABIA21_00045 [Candidatus Aenigmatarchaeota archaeon]